MPNNKNTKSITLRKVILGAHMIAIAIVLWQAFRAIGLNLFSMPIIYTPFFNISYFPLVLLGLYFGCRFALFCVFTYLLLDLWIFNMHTGSLALYQSISSSNLEISLFLWLCCNFCLKVALPHLTYVLVGVLYRKDLSHLDNNKKNNLRLLILLLLITFLQTIFCTLNGLICYLPGIKKLLAEKLSADLLNNNNIYVAVIVFVLNLVPAITTNFLLAIALIVLKPRFKYIYQTYLNSC